MSVISSVASSIAQGRRWWSPKRVGSQRPGKIWIIVWLACVTPALLLSIHTSGAFPLAWLHTPISDIDHVRGHAFISDLDREDLSSRTYPAVASVLENGIRLPAQGNDLHDTIATKGMGRFSFWDESVYFSASDNSDPTKNGRHYEVVAPIQIDGKLAQGANWLAALATGSALFLYFPFLLRLLGGSRYVVSAGLFLVLFVVSRVWFFVDYPIGGIRVDSDSYFRVVMAMDAGHLPDFSMRSPGYPLFMKLVYSFSDTIMGIVWVQVVLSAVSGLYLVYGVHRMNRALSPLAGIAMGAYFGGTLALEHDTALLPEALYVDFILCSFGSLFLALSTRRGVFLFLSSLGMAGAILTRPAGLFLVGSYLITIVFLVMNRYGVRRTLWFVVPLPAVLMVLSAYNYVVVREFTPTAFGESQIAFTTFTFWEQDEGYPGEVNGVIGEVQGRMRAAMTEKDRQVLGSSFSLENRKEFVRIFYAGFDYPTLDVASRVGQGNYMEARSWIRRISLDSIRKHPDLYGKFVITQLTTWYIENIAHQPDFVNYLQDRAERIYVEKRYSIERGDPEKTALAKEFADPPLLPLVRVTGSGETEGAVLDSTSPSRQLYWALLSARKRLFSSPVWSAAFFVVLLLSLFRLVGSKCKHPGSFLLVSMGVSVLGASVVVALVECALDRYSYTMEWVYYLSVALAPVVFLGAENDRTEVVGSESGDLRALTGVI